MKLSKVIVALIPLVLIVSTISPFGIQQVKVSAAKNENLVEINPLSDVVVADDVPGGVSSHTFYDTSSRILTIKQQNKEAALEEFAFALAAIKLGRLGYVTAKHLYTIFGYSTLANKLFTGNSGAQFDIRVTTTIFESKNPTTAYWGYAIMTLKNTLTNEVISSKNIIIGKTGI